jgi:hypothetical protein
LMRRLDCCPAHRTNAMHSFLVCFIWYARAIGLLWFLSSKVAIDRIHSLIHSPSSRYRKHEMHSFLDYFMWYMISRLQLIWFTCEGEFDAFYGQFKSGLVFWRLQLGFQKVWLPARWRTDNTNHSTETKQ